MILNQNGKILKKTIETLPEHHNVELDISQIMPNHVHMIIQNINRAHRDAPLHNKRPLLSKIIGYLKMNTSKSIHEIDSNLPVWQRNYYEHIIRNPEDLNRIREYILDNPMKWDLDKNNPINFKL